MATLTSLPKTHQHLLERVPDLKDVKHYRVHMVKEVEDEYGVYAVHCTDHVAVAVLDTGACFVGVARQNPVDQYVRRLGYYISLGRALKAAGSGEAPDFFVDNELSGRELFEEVESQVGYPSLVGAYPA